MNKKKIQTILFLHIMLMIFSMCGICTKMAGRQPFMSLSFCFYYGVMILILGFYAIGWQQIIKRLPLTVAFANRAITIVWGIIWGVLFFHETISLAKILGACLVITGVVLFAKSDGDEV